MKKEGNTNNSDASFISFLAKTIQMLYHNITKSGWDNLNKTLEIFSDKKYETARYFFVKDDKIIRHIAVSSRTPSSTIIKPNDSFLWPLKTFAEKSDCEIVFCHNHPSGYIVPSEADVTLTQYLENFFTYEDGKCRLIGHTILDHGSYGLYTKKTGWKALIDGKIIDYTKDNGKITGLPPGMYKSQPSLFNLYINADSKEDLMRLAEKTAALDDKNLWNRKLWIPAILASNSGVLKSIEYINRDELNNSSLLTEKIKTIARINGAENIYFFPSDFSQKMACESFAQGSGIVNNVCFKNQNGIYEFSQYSGKNIFNILLKKDIVVQDSGENIAGFTTKEKNKENKQMKKELSKVIVFDTETTGVKAGEDELLQVSIADGNGKELFNSYVKPEHMKKWPIAQKINGISPKTVSSAPTIKELAPKIQSILDGADMFMSYNGRFDVNFLESAGIRFPESRPHLDVIKPAASFTKYPLNGKNDRRSIDGYHYPKLTDIANFFGIDYKAHDSMGDTLATLAVAKRIYGNNLEKLLPEDLSKYTIDEKMNISLRKKPEQQTRSSLQSPATIPEKIGGIKSIAGNSFSRGNLKPVQDFQKELIEKGIVKTDEEFILVNELQANTAGTKIKDNEPYVLLTTPVEVNGVKHFVGTKYYHVSSLEEPQKIILPKENEGIKIDIGENGNFIPEVAVKDEENLAEKGIEQPPENEIKTEVQIQELKEQLNYYVEQNKRKNEQIDFLQQKLELIQSQDKNNDYSMSAHEPGSDTENYDKPSFPVDPNKFSLETMYKVNIEVPRFGKSIAGSNDNEILEGYHFNKIIENKERPDKNIVVLSKSDENGNEIKFEMPENSYIILAKNAQDFHEKVIRHAADPLKLYMLQKEYKQNMKIDQNSTRLNMACNFLHNYKVWCRIKAQNIDDAMKIGRNLYDGLSQHEKQRFNTMVREFNAMRGKNAFEREMYELFEKNNAIADPGKSIPEWTDNNDINQSLLEINREDFELTNGEYIPGTESRVGDTIKLSFSYLNKVTNKVMATPMIEWEISKVSKNLGKNDKVVLYDKKFGTSMTISLKEMVGRVKEIEKQKQKEFNKEQKKLKKSQGCYSGFSR